MLRIIASLLSLGITTASFAAEIPPDDRVLQKLTDGAARGDLPTEMRLLSWNILKGERGEKWTTDFARFTADRDLVLLQEGWQSPLVLQGLAAVPAMSFTMASAFVWKNFMTGVISGFGHEPESLEWRRSPQREPVLNSPKMSLIARFRMVDGRPFVAVNVHGINFVGPDKLKNQLDDVADALGTYDGPLLFAGDFNTWNDARAKVLQDTATRLGLTEVVFERPAGAVLDHVFLRGCRAEKAWVVERVASSDHDPQFVNLNCSQTRP